MYNENCNTEEWLTIKDYPFYQVSSKGRVKRILEGVDEYILKLTLDKNGYVVCNINNQFGRKHKLVHRLVMETFNPTDDHTLEVNHKDCDKTNNNRYNLEWNTRKQNMDHAKENGRMEYKKRSGPDSPMFGKTFSEETKSKMQEAHNKGKDHPNYKLSDEQVYEIKKRRFEGADLKSLANDYNQTEANISLICSGKRRAKIGPEYTIGYRIRIN